MRRLYKTRLPLGFWTWQVNGVRMSVLSSLAPHCPANLTRSILDETFNPDSADESELREKVQTLKTGHFLLLEPSTFLRMLSYCKGIIFMLSG